MEQVETSMDLEMQPPDEHLPINEARDDGWETEDEDEEDSTTGSRLFEKYLDGMDNDKGKSAYRNKRAPDYTARLALEQQNWKDLEGDLMQAYLAWKEEGPPSEEECEDAEFFSCYVIEIKGMLFNNLCPRQMFISFRKGLEPDDSV